MCACGELSDIARGCLGSVVNPSDVAFANEALNAVIDGSQSDLFLPNINVLAINKILMIKKREGKSGEQQSATNLADSHVV